MTRLTLPKTFRPSDLMLLSSRGVKAESRLPQPHQCQDFVRRETVEQDCVKAKATQNASNERRSTLNKILHREAFA